jgi:hypothetical protein
MIPIFLEEETDDLIAAVTRQLRKMVGPEELDDSLVHSLLRNQRLLVIFDALSERTAETKKHVQSIHGTAIVSALVVTSRVAPEFGPTKVTELWPERIDAKTLFYFLTEYLHRTKSDELFPGHHALQLGGRLNSLVEGGSQYLVVTPLLVRLFVDNAIEQRKRNQSIEDLPVSVAETMLEYLRRVNPQDPDTPNRIANETMIQASRVLGRCSLGEDYVPRDIYGDVAHQALSAAGIETPPADIVARLVLNGVLEQRDRGGTKLLRFGLDSLAEYLAALDWLDEHRNDSAKWAIWLAELERVDGYPESIRGFLVALEDCVQTYGEELAILDLIFPWTLPAAGIGARSGGAPD